MMAILLEEQDQARFVDLLLSGDRNAMSAGSWIELAAVITRRGLGAMKDSLDQVMTDARIGIVAVTPAQAEIGHDAYREYGIGSGHRARLNFGDCFAYALAKERGEPLLYKGDDFVHTDIVSAI